MRYCIITLTRSGSTWLTTLLKSHPDVASYFEIFLPHAERSDNTWVPKSDPISFYHFRKTCSAPRPFSTYRYFCYLHEFDKDSTARGFKIMIRDIVKFPEVLFFLILFRYRIVFLTRNIFHAAISRYVSQATGISASTESVGVTAITADIDQLIRDMRRRRLQIRAARVVFSVIPNTVLTVSYEDLSAKEDEVMEQVFRFLRVATTPEPTSHLKKLVSKPYPEVITNFAEVETALRRRGFGDTLANH